MSNNLIHDNATDKGFNELTKRRRTPSKHAEGIKQLKRTINRSAKKEKLSEQIEQSQTPQRNESDDELMTCLKCQLPSGRKLKLSIVIKKAYKRVPIKKKPSIKVQQKEQPKFTLLNAFMTAFQKLGTTNKVQSQQQNRKIEQQGSVSVQNGNIKKKDLKAKKQKEDEDKYIRLYEKYKSLDQRLNENQQSTLWI